MIAPYSEPGTPCYMCDLQGLRSRTVHRAMPELMVLAVLAGVLEACGRRECNLNVIADLSDAGFSALLPPVVARRISL